MPSTLASRLGSSSPSCSSCLTFRALMPADYTDWPSFLLGGISGVTASDVRAHTTIGAAVNGLPSHDEALNPRDGLWRAAGSAASGATLRRMIRVTDRKEGRALTALRESWVNESREQALRGSAIATQEG